MLDHLICILLAYVLESTLLEIQNPALTSTKHPLKVSCQSTTGDLYNSQCKLDLLMCILEAYVLERTLEEIPNPPLTSMNHFLIFFWLFYQRTHVE